MISLSQNTLAWDACVNGIYYHLYGQQATVTYGHIDGTSSYRGDLVIPSSFIYNNKTYTTNFTFLNMKVKVNNLIEPFLRNDLWSTAAHCS